MDILCTGFGEENRNYTYSHGILGRAPAGCQSNRSQSDASPTAQLVRTKEVMLQTSIQSLDMLLGRQLTNEIFSLRRPSQPHAAQTSRAGTSIPHAGHHSRAHDQILPMVLAMAMR